MRILVDTNILISALLLPKSTVAKALLHIANNHRIVLCDKNLAEFRDVIRRKAPEKTPDGEVFLSELSYELIPAVYHVEKLIRDDSDQPILNAAIIADVDIILTGDKDFLSLEMERPICMNVRMFLELERLA